MMIFRTFLVIVIVAVVGYTIPVVANHGLNLFGVFFGDIAKMGWPGQFNVDFLAFLIMSGVWIAWRHRFSPLGLVLGAGQIFLGAPYLATYLLIQSYRANGDVSKLLLGEERAA